jgi:cation transport regulator
VSVFAQPFLFNMPYRTVQDLPLNLRELLPEHAQEIFLKSFNNAWEEYQNTTTRPAETSQEELAFRVAWNAVKKKYAKNKRTGKWELKA